MAVTNYHTVNGIVIGETTIGSPRVDYLTDALGSVTATVNQSGSVVNTYRYKPFGGTLAKTGTGPDPAFTWVGSRGYRPTQNKFSDFYVRRRTGDSATGRWTSRDPLWPRQPEYAYVHNQPQTGTDPSGLGPGCGGEHPRTRSWDKYAPHTDCKDAGTLLACYACAFDYYRSDRGLSPEAACRLANRYCKTIVDCSNPYPVDSIGPVPPPQQGGSGEWPGGGPVLGIGGPAFPGPNPPVYITNPPDPYAPIPIGGPMTTWQCPAPTPSPWLGRLPIIGDLFKGLGREEYCTKCWELMSDWCLTLGFAPFPGDSSVEDPSTQLGLDCVFVAGERRTKCGSTGVF